MLKKIGVYGIFLVSGLVLGYILFMPKTDTLEPAVSSHSDNVGRWTCSMHPKINGKENGTCPLCKMDLVYMDTQVNHGVSESQFKMTKEAVALANIQTSKVSFADTENSSISLSGIITTNKDTDAVQTTLFDGRVDAFYMSSVGKQVRKNQEIGMIYSPDLYLAQDKLLSSVSYKEKNKKLYDAARNTLGLWKMTDEQIDDLIKSKTPQQNFPLYADVSGTVTEVIATEGNYYKQGDVLFKTSDLRTVWAEFDVYESQLNAFEVGQEILIETATLKEPIKAKVSFVEPILNTSKRTATMRVVIPNRNKLLKPGMIVDGHVRLPLSADNLLTVPKSAVLWTGKRSLVYKQVGGNEPVFEPIQIILGQASATNYEVLEGLNKGDVIVTEGTFTVDAAAQLSGRKSMLSNTMDTQGSGEKGKMVPTEIQHRKVPLELKSIPKNSLQEQVHHYILLKDAFVSSDLHKIKKQAKTLLDALPEFRTLITDKVAVGKIDAITKKLQAIENATGLTEQRKYFKDVSEDLLTILSATQGIGEAVYVQHCDCADNNTGGTWLSLQKEIRNPFFGDEMLTCGRVERVIP